MFITLGHINIHFNVLILSRWKVWGQFYNSQKTELNSREFSNSVHVYINYFQPWCPDICHYEFWDKLLIRKLSTKLWDYLEQNEGHSSSLTYNKMLTNFPLNLLRHRFVIANSCTELYLFRIKYRRWIMEENPVEVSKWIKAVRPSGAVWQPSELCMSSFKNPFSQSRR